MSTEAAAKYAPIEEKAVDVISGYKDEFFELICEYLGDIIQLKNQGHPEDDLMRLHVQVRDKAMDIRSLYLLKSRTDTCFDWYCLTMRILLLNREVEIALSNDKDNGNLKGIYIRTAALWFLAQKIYLKMAGPQEVTRLHGADSEVTACRS